MWKSFVLEPHGEWSEFAAGSNHFATTANLMGANELVVRWRAGPSLGFRDVAGKSKTARRACSSYRPPVCAHAAS
jgi:hypothetical protein